MAEISWGSSLPQLSAEYRGQGPNKLLANVWSSIHLLSSATAPRDRLIVTEDTGNIFSNMCDQAATSS